MARKPRVEYTGAFYHVICRGNQRQVIFRNDADRKYYLERMEEYRHRYGFHVYAYVLMSNHAIRKPDTAELLSNLVLSGPRSGQARAAASRSV